MLFSVVSIKVGILGSEALIGLKFRLIEIKIYKTSNKKKFIYINKNILLLGYNGPLNLKNSANNPPTFKI